jgi:hypothetical protein
MPKPVRQRIHPPAVVTGAQPFRPVEIGNVAELELLEPALLRLRHLACQRHFQLAEIAGEIDLAADRSTAGRENQNRMLVHAGLDRLDLTRMSVA